ncbi:hypothetical protein ABIA96_007236, partial [Bradyrhizobium sp. LB11.1]
RSTWALRLSLSIRTVLNNTSHSARRPSPEGYSKKPYPIYELAGPRVYSYEELLRTIARTAGLRPGLVRMPFALWDLLAGVAEILPHPPLTRNQVELMQIDTTASDNLPGFRVLGISPRSLEEELEAMLKQSK